MKQITGQDLIGMAPAATQAAGAAQPLLLDVREPWEFALAAIRI